MSQSQTKALVAQAHTDNPLQQVAALIELIKIHDESVVPELIDLLSSPDEEVRAETARALGYLGDKHREQVGPALLKLLDDEDNRVRNEAVQALGLQPYPGAIEALKKALHHDPYWVVRASAAETLGYYQNEALLDDMMQVLHDEDEESTVQAYAAFAIGLLASQAFRSELDQLIPKATTPQVLSEILAASYRLGGREHLEELLSLLITVEEDDVFSVLSSIQDITERKYPPTLLDDASHIREVLQNLVQRNPLYQGQVKEIIENLNALEQPEK